MPEYDLLWRATRASSKKSEQRRESSQSEHRMLARMSKCIMKCLQNLNPMKECVVCHRVYIDAPGTSGGSQLQEIQTQPPAPALPLPFTPQTIPAESTSSPSTSRPPVPSSNMTRTIPSASVLLPAAPTSSAPERAHAAYEAPLHSTPRDQQPSSFSVESDNPTIFVLQKAITSLTSQLDIAISASPSRPLDVVRVGDISNALSATLSALEKGRKVLL